MIAVCGVYVLVDAGAIVDCCRLVLCWVLVCFVVFVVGIFVCC